MYPKYRRAAFLSSEEVRSSGGEAQIQVKSACKQSQTALVLLLMEGRSRTASTLAGGWGLQAASIASLSCPRTATPSSISPGSTNSATPAPVIGPRTSPIALRDADQGNTFHMQVLGETADKDRRSGLEYCVLCVSHRPAADPGCGPAKPSSRDSFFPSTR